MANICGRSHKLSEAAYRPLHTFKCSLRKVQKTSSGGRGKVFVSPSGVTNISSLKRQTEDAQTHTHTYTLSLMTAAVMHWYPFRVCTVHQADLHYSAKIHYKYFSCCYGYFTVKPNTPDIFPQQAAKVRLKMCAYHCEGFPLEERPCVNMNGREIQTRAKISPLLHEHITTTTTSHKHRRLSHRSSYFL